MMCLELRDAAAEKCCSFLMTRVVGQYNVGYNVSFIYLINKGETLYVSVFTLNFRHEIELVLVISSYMNGNTLEDDLYINDHAMLDMSRVCFFPEKISRTSLQRTFFSFIFM